MNKESLVIGIDPGTNLGLCVYINDIGVRTYGTKLKTSKTDKFNLDKLMHLYEYLDYCYKECKSISGYKNPDVYLFCEGSHGFSRGANAVSLSHNIRGVIKFFCAKNKFQYDEFSPVDVKRFAIGRSKAEKSDIIAVCKIKYGFETTDDNIADAYIITMFAKQVLEDKGLILKK